MERGDEAEDHKDQDDDDEELSKPPTRSKGATKKKASKDPDKGKEGTADDIPIPRKMEGRCKEREPRRHPTIRAGAKSRPIALLASQLGW